jgi:hypothetical protein
MCFTICLLCVTARNFRRAQSTKMKCHGKFFLGFVAEEAEGQKKDDIRAQVHLHLQICAVGCSVRDSDLRMPFAKSTMLEAVNAPFITAYLPKGEAKTSAFHARQSHRIFHPRDMEIRLFHGQRPPCPPMSLLTSSSRGS